ncbi:helix-turn-helix domain-containing protein [Parabacteroides goldsteinii]|uniref:helix-turn-helix domain-containing protein n=1 Tax=Parabacteroides goldsteinii TaxID=328812 RepID=UPI0026114D03|nr:helix-turn-helix transcriptional regulator [Parabacteroides goldsteinii]
MKLDEKLVCLRKEKGLTQLELAEAIKVSRQAVSKWESGGGIPSTENLRGLSELYGVSVDFLLNEEERKPENGNAPKDEPGNNPAPVREERRKVPIKWRAIALVVLILAVIVGMLIVNRSKENLHLGKEKVGEVTGIPQIEFNLEWEHEGR